ncbi:hypothetical protein E2C01_046705 [Portunus trituberculatus]|uniref:Uncharacterized protein n=1 Tax=Portunus trituberculatus TaxID=210409 RepID=A0A5B7G5G4_PORTR|nr:hypothetical protein [Portunus trituberculatus]
MKYSSGDLRIGGEYPACTPSLDTHHPFPTQYSGYSPAKKSVDGPLGKASSLSPTLIHSWLYSFLIITITIHV